MVYIYDALSLDAHAHIQYKYILRISAWIHVKGAYKSASAQTNGQSIQKHDIFQMSGLDAYTRRELLRLVGCTAMCIMLVGSGQGTHDRSWKSRGYYYNIITCFVLVH